MKRCCVHVVAATTRAPRPSPAHPPTPPSSKALDCIHFAECSGCTIEHALDAPPALQVASHYFQGHDVHTIPLSATQHVHEWRTRARLAVRGGGFSDGGGVVIGLFKARSHDAVPIPDCRAHHPLINDAVALLKHHVDLLGIVPYSDNTKQGQLRYVQLTVNDGPGLLSGDDDDDHDGMMHHGATRDTHSTGNLRIQMVLVWNQHPPINKNTPHDPAIDALANALSHGQHLVNALWVNYQPSPNNVIMGPTSRLLWGAPAVWRIFGGTPVYLGPASFVQANTSAMQHALDSMQRFIPDNAVLADLHAGVGTIALALANMVPTIQRAICVEINPDVKIYFNAGVDALHRKWSSTHPTTPPPEFSLHIGAAADAVLHHKVLGDDVEVIVVDPPRKGLEGALLDVLCGKHGTTVLPARCQTLIYLSCGFDALQRDCDALLSSGMWKLVHVETFLFFPGNDALETLVVFERV